MDKPRLIFRGDHFRILQLTDLHLHSFDGRDEGVWPLLNNLLDWEAPDAVAFTGDIACNGRERELLGALNDLLERRSIPYLFTYGNHETDGGRGAELEEILSEFPLCLYQKSAPGVPGFGNYRVPVYASEDDDAPAWFLYSLDCNNDAIYNLAPGRDFSYYGYIRPEQIGWVRRVHARQGAPAIVFCHNPLRGFNDVWMFDGVYGHRGEKVFAPLVNSGFFAALWETGDFRGYFCGHDHNNSYWGRMMGVVLAYGRNSGTNCRCTPGYRRGGRVIELTKNGELTTRLRLDDGSIPEERFHPPLFDRVEFMLSSPEDA